jgi:hypothetical protein
MKLQYIILLTLLNKNCIANYARNSDSVPLPDSIHLVHIVIYGQYSAKGVFIQSGEKILVDEELKPHRILTPATFLNTCIEPDEPYFKIQLGKKTFNLNYTNGKFIRLRRIGFIYFIRQEPHEFGPWRRNRW